MDKILEFLREKAKEDFDIDKNNCVQFTNQCWKIYHGYEWGPEFNSMKSLEEAGFETATQAINSKLKQVTEIKDGCLVAMKLPTDTYLKGIVLGFAIGQWVVFLSPKGIRYLPKNKIHYVWSK